MLSVRIGRRELLRQISLPPLKSGQMMGLIGPNGAGKSTLLNALIGVYRHVEGEVVLAGREPTTPGYRDTLPYVSHMPQALPQACALSPFELLQSALHALREKDVRRGDLNVGINALLDTFELGQLAHVPMSSLSGGKRQLVGLALALTKSPTLLLLDEPTSALDLHWRMSVLEILRNFAQRRSMVVVAALHDLELACRYCDQLVLLDQGRLVAAGTPAEVVTAESLAQTYRVRATVRRLAAGSVEINDMQPIRDNGAQVLEGLEI